MRIYNTLTHKIDEIRIYDTGKSRVKGKRLKMFVCGPTVYDHAHIGHARTYVFFDMLMKYMKYRGLNPFYVMNITDVDDKIIAKARQTGISEKEIADIHTRSFFEDMKALNVKVTKYAKATDFIPQIINQVKILLDKGYAYETPNGIYFDITKFKDYGKLSRQPLNELKVHRIEPDPTKRNLADFSLWKKAKPQEPTWESPWGKGRPGWHIEDTAIAMYYFGEQYDLHGGGIDLIFPHHEAEIAQAEAITGKKPYVRYWIHPAHLVVEGRKMSKSLGNFITIKEALKQSPAEVLRIMFVQAHFKKELNYSKETIETAKAAYERLKTFQERVNELESKRYDKGLRIILGKEKKKFFAALDNNFDTPKAFTILMALIKRLNNIIDKNKLGKKNVLEIKKFFSEIDNIFGIMPKEEKIKLTKEIKELIKEREIAREKKDFDRADKIRAKLKEKGILLEDTPKGPKVRAV
ncbi:cysteine--tRNA ligase [Candidatus Pacearchaeota archaeon ex4484_26]|nr:MAG: cysteine--tRNA ligase [Candidatus Pacearchaeota archaeon ex4484_26]